MKLYKYILQGLTRMLRYADHRCLYCGVYKGGHGMWCGINCAADDDHDSSFFRKA